MHKDRCGSGFTFEVRRTHHAEIRQQQRGIGNQLLECLLDFGRREHDHAHCEIVYFDSQALHRIQKHAGDSLAHLAADHRDVYIVIDSEGCVVTTGHRFRRILRDKSQSNLRPRRNRAKRKTLWQPAESLQTMWH